MDQTPRTGMIAGKVARWAVWIFFVAFIALIGIVLVANNIRAAANHRLTGILAVLLVLTMMLAAATLVCAMALRDVAANNWRFSLRTVMMATTIIAVALGLIMWRLKW